VITSASARLEVAGMSGSPGNGSPSPMREAEVVGGGALGRPQRHPRRPTGDREDDAAPLAGRRRRRPLVLVEGNAELTPNRLVGHHDASRVLTEDYRPENFVPGPADPGHDRRRAALRRGVQPGPRGDDERPARVLSEREMHVPRYGRVAARPTFRLVAAMNPFDAVAPPGHPGAVRPLLPGGDGLTRTRRPSCRSSRPRPCAVPAGRPGRPGGTDHPRPPGAAHRASCAALSTAC
jgi:hypothetical protein